MRNLTKSLGAVVLLILIIIVAYYLYDTFREKTNTEKVAEIIHLEDKRQLSSELTVYLDDPDMTVRSRAALAVGRIGGPKSGELLYPLVTGDAMDVAATAAFALGLTGDNRYADNLLDIAFDAPAKVGAQAVAAAGRLADSTTTDIPKLLTGYLDHPSPEVRKEAALALFRANAADEAAALIDFIADEKDEEVQTAALFTLVRLRIAEAYPVYVDFLADADPFTRSLAVRGVALSDVAEAVKYLSIALNDADQKVVTQAIRGLARKQSTDAKNSLLKKFRREKDEKLTGEIINGLIRQENFEAVDDIHFLLHDTITPENTVAAGVTYLAHALNDRAVTTIDSLMRHDNYRVRSACAEAFGVIGSANNIPRLAVLFKDNHVLVRAAAYNELLTLDSTNQQFYIEQALADSSEILPVLAIDRIKEQKLSEYLPRLYALSVNQKTTALSVDMRRSLIDGVSGFLAKDNPDSIVMRILVNGMLDSDYVVRKETAQLYKTVLDENRDHMIPPAPHRISAFGLRSAFGDYEINPIATITTEKGSFTFELLFDVAPLTVLNFIELAEDDFYDGTIFHRVIADFVAQGGDPTGTGWGGPDYAIRCEYSDLPYRKGTVGVATSGKDTGGSQFFITHSPQPHLDGRYTIFGQVIEGMETVDQLVIGDKIIDITIEQGTSL